MYEHYLRLGEPARLPRGAARKTACRAAARTLGGATDNWRRLGAGAIHGQVLFTRSPSGLLPTDAARELGPHADAMATAAAAFIRASSARPRPSPEPCALCGRDRRRGSSAGDTCDAPERHPRLRFEVELAPRSETCCGRRRTSCAVRRPRARFCAKRVGTVKLGLFAAPKLLGIMVRPAWPTLPRRFHRPGSQPADRSRFAPPFAGATVGDFALARTAIWRQTAIRAGIGVGICHGRSRRAAGLVRVLGAGVRCQPRDLGGDA